MRPSPPMGRVSWPGRSSGGGCPTSRHGCAARVGTCRRCPGARSGCRPRACGRSKPSRGSTGLLGQRRPMRDLRSNALDLVCGEQHSIRHFTRFTGHEPGRFAGAGNAFGLIFFRNRGPDVPSVQSLRAPGCANGCFPPCPGKCVAAPEPLDRDPVTEMARVRASDEALPGRRLLEVPMGFLLSSLRCSPPRIRPANGHRCRGRATCRARPAPRSASTPRRIEALAAEAVGGSGQGRPPTCRTARGLGR